MDHPQTFDRVGTPIRVSASQSQWPVVVGLEYGRLILLSLRNLRCLAQEWVRRGSDIVLDPGQMCGMHNYKMRVCQCRQYQTALYAHLSTLSIAADCIECGGCRQRVEAKHGRGNKGQKWELDGNMAGTIETLL